MEKSVGVPSAKSGRAQVERSVAGIQADPPIASTGEKIGPQRVSPVNRIPRLAGFRGEGDGDALLAKLGGRLKSHHPRAINLFKDSIF